MINKLLTERYRPTNISELILPNRIKDLFQDGKINGNYLFTGQAGTGKTTTAKAITLDYATIYINVSDESGIDTIRNKISTWCDTMALTGDHTNKDYKLVILDEMDGASDQFYKALRATIEKYSDVARFIGTCNYENKVPDAIKSRLEPVSFDAQSKEEEKEMLIGLVKRVYQILQENNIKISKEALISFVKSNYPDMRRILNKIQSWMIQGITNIGLDDIKKLNFSFTEIFDMALGKPDPIRNYKTLVSNYSNKVDDVLGSLGSELSSYIETNYPDKLPYLPLIIIEVANHQAQRLNVIDPVITMVSCVYSIQNIVNDI